MNISRLAAASAVAISLVAPCANAAVTQLNSVSDMTTFYVNDFESSVNGGPITFTNAMSSPFSSANATHSVTPSGSFGLLSSSFPQTVYADLSTPFTAVGLYFGNDDTCCSQGFSAMLEVFQGSTSLGSVSVVANMNDYADQFIGLSSTIAFDRVSLSYGASTGLYVYADDFRVGAAAPVPEPETYAMLLAGLGLLGFTARRRRQSA